MKKISFVKLAPLAAGLTLLAGCIVEQQAPPAGTEGADNPPAVQTEVVPPQPDITFIWTPGFWDWQGHWVWRRGYWGPRPHPGSVWIRGGWVSHGGHRVWVHPHWS